VAEDATGRLGRRLGRILVLLPYAIKHPGVSVAELARKFGVTKHDLLEDLQLVFLCGLPGYGPGDLIDVDLDEDRVYVRMADYFSAPLRLTPAEALLLYAGGATVAALPELEEADALRRALRKLGRALGVDAEHEGSSGLTVSLESSGDEHLADLRRSLEERKRVRLEYYSASRGELSEREIEPWGILAALGRWYLIALDLSSGEERMFRLDRIKELAVLEEAASIPDEFDPEIYRGAFRDVPSEPVMNLEISPEAARWFEDYYPVTQSDALDDGWRAVAMRYGNPRWAATLILQLGSDVRRVEPKEVLDGAEELAERIRKAHDRVSSRRTTGKAS
jgi:proteasome accessory factor C